MASQDTWESLYRMVTVRDWKCSLVKEAFAAVNKSVLEDNTADRECGQIWLGILFFILFGIFGTMVFLNLFIAIILDVYKDNVILERNLQSLQSDEGDFALEDWKQVWIEVEQKYRSDMGLSGKLKGWLPVKHFLGTMRYSPQLVGAMLDAAGLRLNIDADRSTEDDWEQFGCENEEEFAELLKTEFCGRTNRVPLSSDKNVIVKKDHINALVKSHKWHLLCKLRNAHTIDEEWVVYYDDAVFSIVYFITGPTFPIFQYDNALENPLVKWLALNNDEEDEEYEDESDDLDDLAQMMETEPDTLAYDEKDNDSNYS